MRASDGKRLRMGTALRRRSARAAHTRNATRPGAAQPLVLERAMERFGFAGYWREWWHFERPARALPTWISVWGVRSR